MEGVLEFQYWYYHRCPEQHSKNNPGHEYFWQNWLGS